MNKTILTALLLLLLLPGSAWARLEISREVLPDGLTLLVAEKHNLPLVRVNVCVQAGTLVEPPQKAGLANLTASLLPEGTKSRTSVQISEAIDFMGASLASSGDNDFVTVTLSLLKKDVDQGFEILSDVLQNPAFIDEEVQKHKKRI